MLSIHTFTPQAQLQALNDFYDVQERYLAAINGIREQLDHPKFNGSVTAFTYQGNNPVLLDLCKQVRTHAVVTAPDRYKIMAIDFYAFCPDQYSLCQLRQHDFKEVGTMNVFTDRLGVAHADHEFQRTYNMLPTMRFLNTLPYLPGDKHSIEIAYQMHQMRSGYISAKDNADYIQAMHDVLDDKTRLVRDNLDYGDLDRAALVIGQNVPQFN